MNQYYYHKVYIVVLIYISHIALNEISCTIKLIPVISEYLFEDAPSGYHT